MNGTSVQEISIQPGDKIQVGSATISVHAEHVKGEQTLFREVQDGMEQGKGYPTMLREIVGEAGKDEQGDGSRP